MVGYLMQKVLIPLVLVVYLMASDILSQSEVYRRREEELLRDTAQSELKQFDAPN